MTRFRRWLGWRLLRPWFVKVRSGLDNDSTGVSPQEALTLVAGYGRDWSEPAKNPPIPRRIAAAASFSEPQKTTVILLTGLILIALLRNKSIDHAPWWVWPIAVAVFPSIAFFANLGRRS